jgi:hypothetical protein
MQEGTEYTIRDGYVIVNSENLSDDGRMHQYRTPISFPDRDTMLWGTESAAEVYRRMTDDEIAFFTLQLDYYNPEYDINETNFTIPMTGGNTTTGGSGSNNFENAASESIKAFVDYYTTWDPEINGPITNPTVS